MDTARTVLPAIGLLLGVGLGWMWGQSTIPVPVPPAPVVATCPPSLLEGEVRGLELEVSLLRAEMEEGW